MAATQPTRGNSTTIIHLAFVICTFVAAVVTLTDSDNLVSDPFRDYTHTHTEHARMFSLASSSHIFQPPVRVRFSSTNA
jgi:hypothetical protein